MLRVTGYGCGRVRGSKNLIPAALLSRPTWDAQHIDRGIAKREHCPLCVIVLIYDVEPPVPAVFPTLRTPDELLFGANIWPKSTPHPPILFDSQLDFLLMLTHREPWNRVRAIRKGDECGNMDVAIRKRGSEGLRGAILAGSRTIGAI